eukprot:1192295-Prorocentrum_minimum.AAC.2
MSRVPDLATCRRAGFPPTRDAADDDATGGFTRVSNPSPAAGLRPNAPLRAVAIAKLGGPLRRGGGAKLPIS